MRRIDLATWPRRAHFEVFSAFDHPHFGMCANVDVTAFCPAVKRRGYSINSAIVYAVSRAANAIREFRYRIRDGEVVEHEVVHPGITVMGDDDLFTFCFFDYVEDFRQFALQAAERVAYYQAHPTLEDDPDRDDLLFMTAIPWVSFTSFLHPMHYEACDSIPRFAWGKFFQEGDALKMPLGVQGHHALMDGLHVGRFYAVVEEILQGPDEMLDQT